MDSNDNGSDDKAPNRYEERIAAKRERYAERATKARREATIRERAARTVMDGIPLGQPILVGHHSERRHRRDIARIDTNLRKSVEASEKADYYDHKAESYGTHGISSDDPEAVAKLRAQLDDLNACRAAEKLWNRELKVAARARAKELGRALTQGDHLALVESLPIPDPIKRGLMSMARAFPWLPQFGNNTQANIRRVEQRIAELERKAASPERKPLTGTVLDATGRSTGYTIEWSKADNRVQVFTAFKPCADVIARLKGRGFRWARSVGAWQRQASEGAWYDAKQCVGHKDDGKVETVTRAPWHAQPWPCGHSDPIFVDCWTQRCAVCGVTRHDPGHCQGCDQDRETKPYNVTFTNGTTERVRYCDDCAGLAAMNYNGETASIAPETED